MALVPFSSVAQDALTNEGVVALAKAGLSPSLVIAKIRQAPKVDFRLDVDDLVALREAGLKDDVIEAMLARSTPAGPWGVAPTPSVAAAPAVSGDPWAGVREDLGIEFIKVALESREGVVPLKLVRGEMTSSGFMAYRLQFMDYPGTHARVRIRDRRPSLLVRSSTPVTGGRYFFAKLDRDDDDGIRSLKVSSAKGRFKAAFGGSDRGFLEPDDDWVLEFDAVEESPEIWRVTARVDLEPGEYGWYVDPATMSALGGLAGPQSQQAGGLFDFGVD